MLHNERHYVQNIKRTFQRYVDLFGLFRKNLPVDSISLLENNPEYL